MKSAESFCVKCIICVRDTVNRSVQAPLGMIAIDIFFRCISADAAKEGCDPIVGALQTKLYSRQVLSHFATFLHLLGNGGTNSRGHKSTSQREERASTRRMGAYEDFRKRTTSGDDTTLDGQSSELGAGGGARRLPPPFLPSLCPPYRLRRLRQVWQCRLTMFIPPPVTSSIRTGGHYCFVESTSLDRPRLLSTTRRGDTKVSGRRPNVAD
jgi:hypothetical protein